MVFCSDAHKSLILLGFSKSSVSPLIPSEYPLGYSDFLLPICKFSHVVAQECATFVVWEPVCRRTCSLLHTGGLSMTEENYNYRTSQKLLRNQFPGKGKFKIPIIPKF